MQHEQKFKHFENDISRRASGEYPASKNDFDHAGFHDITEPGRQAIIESHPNDITEGFGNVPRTRCASVGGA